MNKKLSFATFAVLTGFMSAGIGSETAHGKSLKCNKRQTTCEVRTKDLTIGDRVGVFNPEGVLVAVGEVKKIRSQKRTIKIKKRHGDIDRKDRIALLDTKGSLNSAPTKYKTFNEKNRSIGASAGYTYVGIAQGISAFGVSIWRPKGGLEYVVRGSFISGEGETAINENNDTSEATYGVSLTGFGGMGGVGYTMLKDKPMSFRVEGVAGMLYTQYDAPAAEDEAETAALNDIESGIGFVSKGTISALWNLEKIGLSFDLATGMYHEAPIGSFAAGLHHPF